MSSCFCLRFCHQGFFIRVAKGNQQLLRLFSEFIPWFALLTQQHQHTTKMAQILIAAVSLVILSTATHQHSPPIAVHLPVALEVKPQRLDGSLEGSVYSSGSKKVSAVPCLLFERGNGLIFLNLAVYCESVAMVDIFPFSPDHHGGSLLRFDLISNRFG